MKSRKKLFLTILGAVLLVAVVAAGTVWALSKLAPQDDASNNTQTGQQASAEEAQKHVDSATEQEALGNTDDAIAEWEKALSAFQAAGDKAGEEGVKLQLDYLRNLGQPIKNGTPVENEDVPIQDEEEEL